MQNKMIDEGRKRLDILLEMGLWDEVAKVYDRDEKICLSETMNMFGICGVNFVFDEKPELKAIKEKFEAEYDCFVYYGTFTRTTMGTILNLLFVSRNEKAWGKEKRDLKKGIPYAYVWNLDDEFGEVGSIQIEMMQGGLVRVG